MEAVIWTFKRRDFLIGNTGTKVVCASISGSSKSSVLPLLEHLRRIYFCFLHAQPPLSPIETNATNSVCIGVKTFEVLFIISKMQITMKLSMAALNPMALIACKYCRFQMFLITSFRKIKCLISFRVIYDLAYKSLIFSNDGIDHKFC